MEKNLKPNLYTWSLRGSLTLLALLPLLPLFAPWHLNPVRSFHDEWLAVMTGLLAWLVAMPLLRQAGDLHLPSMVLLPLGLMAFIAVQSALLPQVIAQHAQMAMLYLLWAALLMALVGLLVKHVGRLRISLWLAGGLTSAAVCAGLAEVGFRLNGVPGWWGGTAQANNYGDLLALGLASGVYLLGIGKPVWRGCCTASLLVIVLGLSLTPSRSVWLYWLVMLLIAWRWQRPLLKILLAGFGLYLLLQALWTSGLLPTQSSPSATERLYQSVEGAPIRLHIWQVAWQLFLREPWLGQGFGQFDWSYFQAGQHIPELGNRVEHAHNLILHLLAELGVFPVLLLIVILGLWLKGLFIHLQGNGAGTSSSQSLWLAMVVAVLGIHSMLEYPLWYAQFLGICAVVLALGDDSAWTVRLGFAGKAALAMLLVIGVGIASIHEWNYAKLEQASLEAEHSDNPLAFVRLIDICKQASQQAPLLSPYIAAIFTNATRPADSEIRRDLSLLTNTAFHFLPAKTLAYRQAMMQGLNGAMVEAMATLDLAIKAYPDWAEMFLAELRTLSPEDQVTLQPLRDMAAVVRKGGVHT